MATVRYIKKNLTINIFIAKTDLDSTDVVLIYETITDPSNGDLVATIKSAETDNDPSFGESYLFSYTKVVSIPKTYSFYYTTRDKFGNESEIVEIFDTDVCLTPFAPAVIDFDSMTFGRPTVGAGLTDGLYAQLNMNDNAADTIVVDNMGNINPVYDGSNTSTKSVAGKIGTALDFPAFQDFINLNSDLATIFNDSFSVNLWIKPVVAAASDKHIFGAGTGSQSVFLDYDLGNLVFHYAADGTVIEETSAHGFSNGAWSMVTITCEEVNATTVRVIMYVDNVQIKDSGNITVTMADFTGSGNIFIGAIQEGSPSGLVSAVMDAFTWWNKKLSVAEINTLWNGGSGTETMPIDVDEFQTIFYQNVATEAIVEVGDMGVDITNIGVVIPADADYNYYRTYSNIDCSTESSDSDNLPITIDTSAPIEEPLTDASNLFLTNVADGAFQLTFNFNTVSTDPVTSFSIYIDRDGNPSATNFSLDGTLTYSSFINRFTYTTTTNPDDLFVWVKVVPVAGSNERDNDIMISGTSDALAPIVIDQQINITLS